MEILEECCSLAFSMPCSECFLTQPRIACPGLVALIKKMPYWPIWRTHFPKWGSFFSYGPGLCQADKNPTRTQNRLNGSGVRNTAMSEQNPVSLEPCSFTCSLLWDWALSTSSVFQILIFCPSLLSVPPTAWGLLMQHPMRCLDRVSEYLPAVSCGRVCQPAGLPRPASESHLHCHYRCKHLQLYCLHLAHLSCVEPFVTHPEPPKFISKMNACRTSQLLHQRQVTLENHQSNNAFPPLPSNFSCIKAIWL